jgi:hypothetical protein
MTTLAASLEAAPSRLQTGFTTVISTGRVLGNSRAGRISSRVLTLS